jgi:hypothetical protein
MHEAGLGAEAWVSLIGYLGAALTISVYSMKRMIPLRVLGICANCALIAYSFLAGVYPQLVMSAVLLPINIYRLHEMLDLVRKVKLAAASDLNMEWLKPFMSRRIARSGEVIFRKGDESAAMFYTVSGLYRLDEIQQDVGSGDVIGEIGLIAPENKRTLTLTCVEDGELLTISYDHVKQLFFQNPEFGFYFLQLVSKRLFKDIERSQQPALAERRIPGASGWSAGAQ